MDKIESIKMHSLEDFVVSYYGSSLCAKGNNKSATNCVIHDGDKKPSLIIEKDQWVCWTCDKRGDIIDLVMETNNCDKGESIEILCQYFDIKIPNNKPTDSRYGTLKWVSTVYQSNLNSFSAIREYLHSRKISDKTIEKYNIGYVPAQNFFVSRAKTLRENFYELGLIIKNREDNTKEYDLFRNRVMFPIKNKSGHVVGFGGRINPESKSEAAKYINSKDSELFKKSDILYGLSEAIKDNESSRFKEIYVEEGYMDVIASSEAGIINVVGTCGTAFTTSHIELLFKHTDHVVFVFDGDIAGQKAMRAAILTSLPYMNLIKQISIVRLEKDKDPGNYVEKDQVDEFKSKLELTIGFEEIIIEILHEIEGRSEFYKRSLQEDALNKILKDVDSDLAELIKKYVSINLRNH
jgi:DNA primase